MNQDQIRQLEQLCETLYTTPSAQERKAAEQQLSVFTTVEGALQAERIISVSKNPYAVFFACSTLLSTFTNNWNSFTPQQVVDLRNFLFNFLGQNGPVMPHFVLTAMIQLMCRLTKLGWHDDKSHRELPEKINQYFLQASPELVSVGLQILNQLITDINTTTHKMTLTAHRKIAVAFRDMCMKNIFEYALLTFRKLLAMPTIDEKICDDALQVVLGCMRFDFVGIFPDESTDDVGRNESTVQVPASWKPFFEDPETQKLFWDLYDRLSPEKAAKVLECLVMLASVRRSLFSSEKERKVFLEGLMLGTQSLLETRKGLNDQKTYHEFCRLLARIKSNFQLNEIVSCDNYNKWINLVAKFSVESFQSWQWTNTSVYYLLNLWSRLVSSIPYLKGDKTSNLDSYVPEIIQAFIASRMELAKAVVVTDGNIENPLEEEERLTEQLEALPTLVHSNFEKIIPSFLEPLFDPLLSSYQQAIGLPSGQVNSKDIEILEGQLSWLVYIFGSIIGQRATSNRSEATDLLDGELCGRVLQCTALIEQRLLKTPESVNDESLQRFESAILYFLQSFRKVYIGESAISTSKVYARLSALLGLGDHLAVLNVIVNKVGSNLKVWGKCSRIIAETLELFYELASGYSSAKLMLKLDTIRFLLSNHNNEHFTFLSEPSNFKMRTKYYCTLCKLLFMQDYSEALFTQFMSPLEQVCVQLEHINNQTQFRQDNVKFATVGLLRDLRGICMACMNRQTYNNFFDWIFPAHTPLLTRIAEVWYDTPDVMNVLLKFMSEFVLNRSQRISFDSSSPNGILLFKETSKVLVAYGTRITSSTPRATKDPYQDRYKGIWICMQILARSLSGNYCNFGVFTLYGDRALADALDVLIKIVVSIPVDDIMAFPKVCKAYFALIEILFSNHTAAVVQFDSAIFLHLLASLEPGIKSPDNTISSQACSALDHLCTFYFKQAQKNTDHARALQQHLVRSPDLLPRLLALLFNLVMFENIGNQWAMSRPMLSLIVINDKFFNESLKMQIATSVGPERQEKMVEALNKLMDGIEPNLETKNRERFTGNLAQFKSSLKTFL